MEKVRPWCGQPSDRGRLRNRTELLMARARLAPMKSVTIPRLELMAAVLAVKVDHMLKRELDIEPMKTVLWTDSTTVLQCIYCSEH